MTVWLKMLFVVTSGHASTIIIYVNPTHKVAGSAFLSNHGNHRDSASSRSLLLTLRSMHVWAHWANEDTCWSLRYLSLTDAVHTALVL